jgi:putative Mg2+ transporter-C (MgtC) family protein
MLMAAGACLFTLVTLSLGEGDPQRVVQGMLMGTGFIAGGVIFRQGPSVHGLTTAVGLWVTSAVGLAVGLGDYFLAIATTVLTLVVMSTFQRLERKAARAPAAEDGGGPPPPDASGRA